MTNITILQSHPRYIPLKWQWLLRIVILREESLYMFSLYNGRFFSSVCVCELRLIFTINR